jgi:hypothetical protein
MLQMVQCHEEDCRCLSLPALISNTWDPHLVQPSGEHIPSLYKRAGRPKGSQSAVKAVAGKAPTKTVATKKTRKPLSAEARKRIADAQKARWAKAKNARQ